MSRNINKMIFTQWGANIASGTTNYTMPVDVIPNDGDRTFSGIANSDGLVTVYLADMATTVFYNVVAGQQLPFAMREIVSTDADLLIGR